MALGKFSRLYVSEATGRLIIVSIEDTAAHREKPERKTRARHIMRNDIQNEAENALAMPPSHLRLEDTPFMTTVLADRQHHGRPMKLCPPERPQQRGFDPGQFILAAGRFKKYGHQ